jgi:hypothetical protein
MIQNSEANFENGLIKGILDYIASYPGAGATFLTTPSTKGFHATLLALGDNLVPLWNPTFFKN